MTEVGYTTPPTTRSYVYRDTEDEKKAARYRAQLNWRERNKERYTNYHKAYYKHKQADEEWLTYRREYQRAYRASKKKPPVKPPTPRGEGFEHLEDPPSLLNTT